MKDKKLIIAGVIIIIVTVIFGGKALLDRPGAEKEELAKIEAYVFLDTPTISEENEGKTLVVRGQFTGVENAYDKTYDVTFDYPVVQRRLYNYTYRTEDKDDDDDETTYRGEWKKGAAIALPGKVKMGDFAIDNAFYDDLPYFERISASELEDTNLQNLYRFKINGARVYSKSRVPTHNESNLRYKGKDYEAFNYEAFDMEQTVTLIGVQKGNKLVEADRATTAYKDAVTKADLEKEVRTSTIGMYIGIGVALAIGVMLVIIGKVKS